MERDECLLLWTHNLDKTADWRLGLTCSEGRQLHVERIVGKRDFISPDGSFTQTLFFVKWKERRYSDCPIASLLKEL